MSACAAWIQNQESIPLSKTRNRVGVTHRESNKIGERVNRNAGPNRMGRVGNPGKQQTRQKIAEKLGKHDTLREVC
jgi:hypothetical protein